MKSKRIISIAVLIAINIMLCGAAISKEDIAVNTEKYHVYELCTVDEIISDYSRDKKKAEDTYEKNYYVLSGEISEIKKNKAVFLKGTGQDSDVSIECSTADENIIRQIEKLAAGDNVFVYGKLSVDIFDGNFKVKKMDKITSAVPSKAPMTYYLADEKATNINLGDMAEETLHNGAVKYRVPKSWESVKHNIQSEELGIIEGCQYNLNLLSDTDNSIPEAFFVCYFENAYHLMSKSDYSKTKLVEKAIVENISGKDIIRFFPRKVTTYYGAKYQYYVDKYEDLLGKPYRTEYIFQQDGNDGLVMYLYVYDKDCKHINDILFVTRFLEILP